MAPGWARQAARRSCCQTPPLVAPLDLGYRDAMAGNASGARTIVFLAANASYSHSSLAAACLRMACADLPWRWETIEVTTAEQPDAVLQRIVAHRPAIVAAALYLFNREFVLSVLRQLPDSLPSCVRVVGGPECLGDNRDLLLEKRMAEAAIRGEGESALRQLLNAFDTPGAWAAIPGFCGAIDGAYVDRGRAEEPAPLDALRSPYGVCYPVPGKPFTLLETSRGCANECTFCTSALASGTRCFSVERVRQDVAAIRAQGVREVRLVDRTFNADPTRCVALLRMFREEFADLRFHLEIDPALLVRPILAQLDRAPAGQLHLEVGVQSLDASVYRNIRRKAGVRRTLEGLKALCARSQLGVHADLMAGLPGQTIESLLRDIAVLVALRPQEIQLEVLKVLPGTALARDRERWGLRAAAAPPYNVQATPDMRTEDLALAAGCSRVLDIYYNVPALRGPLLDAAAALPGFWREFAECVQSRRTSSTGLSLETRVRLLHTYTAERVPAVAQRLCYLWLRLGFSARKGLCPVTRWRGPLPEDAACIDGERPARVSRQYRAELDRPYWFVYGLSPSGKGRAIAVFASRTPAAAARPPGAPHA